MKWLKKQHLLVAIFVFAIIIRFLYFPGNTQFAYDQARDAYASQEILTGDIKLIGPPSTFLSGLRHGVLFYYMAAPIYFLSSGNPEGLSIVLRLFNALGVIAIFFLALQLFNKKTAYIAAFLFAISFEQTQYALFLGHPPLAILPLILFYYGLSQYFLKQKSSGMILSTIGLGLAVQFHVGLIFLLPLPFIMLAIFYKSIPKTSPKIILFSVTAFLLTISTFIIEAIKNNFLVYKNFNVDAIGDGGSLTVINRLSGLDFTINRFINHNFIFQPVPFLSFLIVIILFIAAYMLKKQRKSILFLLLWFIWGLLPYFLRPSVIYYYSMGTSLSLLIIAAYLLNTIPKKLTSILVGLVLLFSISNGYLIKINNQYGPIRDITSQDGMILSDQKKIVDYTYNEANLQPFAVNALSIPFHVNTTWSYVYNFYGKNKYGYLPVWGGDHAAGYPTSLEINTNRSSLPPNRFLIIEQTQGLKKEDIDRFISEEYIFSNKISENEFGLIKVHTQTAK